AAWRLQDQGTPAPRGSASLVSSRDGKRSDAIRPAQPSGTSPAMSVSRRSCVSSRLGACPGDFHIAAGTSVPLRAPASPAQSVSWGVASEGGQSPPPRSLRWQMLVHVVHVGPVEAGY